jgi:helix-turn-helix protein
MSIASTGLGDDEAIVPRVYKLSEVAVMLKISRTQAYQLAEQGLFPTFRVGTGRNSLRAPCEGVDRLLRVGAATNA